MSRRVQQDTGLAIENVVKQLRRLRHASIVINGATGELPPQIPAPQREILERMRVEPGF